MKRIPKLLLFYLAELRYVVLSTTELGTVTLIKNCNHYLTFPQSKKEKEITITCNLINSYHFINTNFQVLTHLKLSDTRIK